MKSFFRRLGGGTYLSLVGGTLVSGGVGAYINVVGSTSLPNGVGLLLGGSVCLTISGVLIFAAAVRLDGMLKPLAAAPPSLRDDDLVAMWDQIFSQQGRLLSVLFGIGAVLGSIGVGVLTYRLTLI